MLGQIAMAVQYLGMAVAMAGGAPWSTPNWTVVLVGLVVAGGGIAMKRWADRRDPRFAASGEEGPARGGTVVAATKALAAMVERVDAMVDTASTAALDEIAKTIEAVQLEGTEQVAASQDALVRAYSFARYATVMGPLASAERWLYRAWSAASDGHRDETVHSIKTAAGFAHDAKRALGELTGGAAS